jgi:hypothetical protein
LPYLSRQPEVARDAKLALHQRLRRIEFSINDVREVVGGDIDGAISVALAFDYLAAGTV